MGPVVAIQLLLAMAVHVICCHGAYGKQTTNVEGHHPVSLYSQSPFGSSGGADRSVGGPQDDHTTVCSCMCCLQGTCVPVANATWTVSSCSMCSQADCLERAAMLDALWSSETRQRHVARSACFVLHSTEQKTCSGMTERQCKRFTSIRPQCTTRSNYLQTLCCIGWTVVVGALMLKKLLSRYYNAAAP